TPIEKLGPHTNAVPAASTDSRTAGKASYQPVVPETTLTPSEASRRIFAGAACGVEKSTATSAPARDSRDNPEPCGFFALLMRARTSKPKLGASCSTSRPIFPYPTMATPRLIRRSLPGEAVGSPCAHKPPRLPAIPFSEYVLRSCAQRGCCRDQSGTALPTRLRRTECP